MTKNKNSEDLFTAQTEILTQFANTTQHTILPDRNTPLTTACFVTAHNPFSSEYSAVCDTMSKNITISDVLDVGVRGIELDLYLDRDQVKLSHVLSPEYCVQFNRTIDNVCVEMREWCKKNPGEVVMLKCTEGMKGIPTDALNKTIRQTLAPELIFTPNDMMMLDNKLPSINTIADMGKQLVVMSGHTTSDHSLIFNETSQIFANSKSGMISFYNISPSSRVGQCELIQSDIGDWQVVAEGVDELLKRGISIIKHTMDVVGNVYVFVPTAIVVGMFTCYGVNKSFINKKAEFCINAIVNKVLPEEGRVLYYAATEATNSYINSTEVESSRLKTIGKSAANFAARGTGEATKIVATTAVALNIAPSSLLHSLYGKLTNFISTKLILDPLIGIVKELYNSGVSVKSLTKGFVSGVDASTFYLTNFAGSLEDPNEKMLNIATLRWQRSLDKLDIHDNIHSELDLQRKMYNDLVERGESSYLRSNPGAKKIDLLSYPSFEAVHAHLQKAVVIAASKTVTIPTKLTKPSPKLR